MRKRFGGLVLGAALLIGAGCAKDGTAPAVKTEVLDVIPTGGATGVDPTQPIVVSFSGPMQMGMEMYVALHEGDVRGPVVPGTDTWSADGKTLTFTPAAVLKPGTAYTLHLGGGMLDADGDEIGYDECVDRMGGQWATQQMMGGGMGSGMMGPGWQNANGSYGMIFTFTTV